MAALGGQDNLTDHLFSQAGVITINTDLLVINCQAKRYLSIQVIAMGTTGVITPSFSNDGITWYSVPVVNPVGVSADVLTGASSLNLWTTPVFGKFFRLRMTTATTAGPTTLAVVASALPFGEPTTLPTVITGNPAVIGPVAHDGARGSTAPVITSARAVNVNYAAVATGDVADNICTLVGAQISKPYAIPEAGWSASLLLTNTTAQALNVAGAAGIKNHITALQAINVGASTVNLLILDGGTVRWQLPLPQNVPMAINFPTELVTTAATALNANIDAVGTVRVNAQGYRAP